MDLVKWAVRHNISMDALTDLKMQMGILPPNSLPPPAPSMSEGAVSNSVRLAASKTGTLLWRNNVGAMQDDAGNVVRYGLANDSKKMNQAIKSSDLIGIKPNGQFICREVKKSDWQYSGTPHELAQLRFIELVLSKGGDAAFTTGVSNI